MSEELDNIENQLRQFGLSSIEVTLYLQLLEKGKDTPLELSRKLKIARTKIYRTLEKLIEKGLVIERVEGHGKKFEASSPQRLLDVVNQKEKDLLLLKSSAPTIVGQLNNLITISSTESKILHYRGLEGLKQVTWNSTKVKDIFRIYEFGPSMNNFLDFDFAEKVRRKYAQNESAEFRQLTNHEVIEESTKVKEHIQQWKPRFIDKSELDIKFEVQIYNDVYCMYEYTKDDVFIVEIYNQQLADFQKQVFDLIWGRAEEMKKVGEFGRAEI